MYVGIFAVVIQLFTLRASLRCMRSEWCHFSRESDGYWKRGSCVNRNLFTLLNHRPE